MRAGFAYGLVHPHLEAFFRNLPPLEHLSRQADCRLYRERPHWVCEVACPPYLDASRPRLVIKRFGRRGGWRGVQNHLLSPCRRSRARKAYRTACHLLSRGLLTPIPVAALEARRWGFLCYEVYATEALEDAVSVRQYIRTLPRGSAAADEVMRLVADYARRLHDSGLWHRDMNLDNFLLTGPAECRRLYLIDLNRVRHVPCMPTWLRALDLVHLDWREWQLRFCDLYCSDRFVTARLLRVMRLCHTWRRWRRRVLTVLRPWRAWRHRV